MPKQVRKEQARVMIMQCSLKMYTYKAFSSKVYKYGEKG